jgi:predicted Fe-Mo cluster-binding NifX family protein
MKYGIPTANGQLSQHFGGSTAFALIEAENGKIISKENIPVVIQNCSSLPTLMAERGVKVVLAGGMGFSPRAALEHNGIEVVLGVTETDPEKAVLAHLNSTLVSGQNACDHGDAPCDHSHGHGDHHGECH